MKKKINTIFLGSNWEALAILKTLYVDSRFNIVAIITQPDKPIGRKRIIIPSDIKNFGKQNNIPVEHTENKKEKYNEIINKYTPDLIVCISFGELIPESFLIQPPCKAINVHFSLLPKYRGAVPIQKAILEGENETGISIVQMVKALDAGPILSQHKVKILPTDTNQILRKKLIKLTSEILPDKLSQWCNNEIIPIEQNHKNATYCQQSDISKDKAYIDINLHTSVQIDRMVRAFIPWPVAWTKFQNKMLKIFSCSIIERESTEIIKNIDNFILFKTQEINLTFGFISNDNKVIMLNEIQIEGKNKISGSIFANGIQGLRNS